MLPEKNIIPSLLAEYIVDKIQSARDKEWAEWILETFSNVYESHGDVSYRPYGAISVADFEELKKLVEE